jgi:hypothetical protein
MHHSKLPTEMPNVKSLIRLKDLLVLLAALDVVEKCRMNYAKELQKIPLEFNMAHFNYSCSVSWRML